MSKTPEELAEEYVLSQHHVNVEYSGILEGCKNDFLAGYKAAQEADTCEHILDMSKMVDVNGWISVKNEMPKNNEYVLLFINFSIDTQQFKLIEMGYFNGNAWDVGNDIYSLGFVSHWQELPEPPKEEG